MEANNSHQRKSSGESSSSDDGIRESALNSRVGWKHSGTGDDNGAGHAHINGAVPPSNQEEEIGEANSTGNKKIPTMEEQNQSTTTCSTLVQSQSHPGGPQSGVTESTIDSRIAIKVAQERQLQNQGTGNASAEIDLESNNIPQNAPQSSTGRMPASAAVTGGGRHDQSFASGHHHPGPQSATESTIDSRIAIKVVQERLLQNQGNASTEIDLESSDIPQNAPQTLAGRMMPASVAVTGGHRDQSFAFGHHPGQPQSVTESTLTAELP
ncbi:expressed unknown protein [Seminavis robusta]|uniref:Uncharacterized protein n=1 Tax=Seminavis robusta TaxID=568900 RepID=A0A9N8DA99_9STRA|nr:expressed unknown protein [Seminavis robusta]|eukprot:Sro62_g035540.1 n/a (268) ;mRNA; f:115913-116716